MKGVTTRTIAILIAVIVVVAVIAGIMMITGPSPTPTTPTTPATSPTTSPASPTTTPTTQITPVQKYALHETVLYIIANEEMTRIQLFKAGVADIATITPSRWKDLNGTRVGDFYLVLEPDPSKPRLTIQHVILNTMKEPLNIPEVRQALAWATPYDTILTQVFGELYTRLYTIVPKGMPGWTDYNIVKYEYNRTKATEIINSLKAKGFDPSKYSITIMYNLGNTARAQIAALLQNEWTRLGFKVYV
jgi:peptide/nickel transport system substrate-binding protein